jgi:hypothetical protein
MYSSFLSLLMLCAKSLQHRTQMHHRVPIVTSVTDEETAKNIRKSRRRKAQAAAVLQPLEDHRRTDRRIKDQNERDIIKNNVRAGGK